RLSRRLPTSVMQRSVAPVTVSWLSRRRLDRIPGGFGVVAAPGWGGPAERPVGELVDGPAGLLLEPMVVPALRLLSVILTHMTIGDAIRLAELGRPPDGGIRFP